MKKLVVGVKFRKSGKLFYFELKDLELEKGDAVLVETVNGLELGNVMSDPRMVPEEEVEEVYPIIRKATREDINHNNKLKMQAKQAEEVFNNVSKIHRLRMNLIDVTFTFDERKLIYYYTADGRVDFRDMVRDLAGHFHARIELRQIGAREEARKFAGVGTCGRPCCCSSWLSDFAPVSIKMAKEQNLSLNSTKISGVCGRLLCCLNYEEEYYEELSKIMPNIGDEIISPNGMGVVYKLNPLEESVLMKFKNDKDEVEIKSYTLEELTKAANGEYVEEEEIKLEAVEEVEVPEVNEEDRQPKRKQQNKRRFRNRNKRRRRAKNKTNTKRTNKAQQKGNEKPKKEAKKRPKTRNKKFKRNAAKPKRPFKNKSGKSKPRRAANK